jgi:hypothetical protein
MNQHYPSQQSGSTIIKAQQTVVGKNYDVSPFSFHKVTKHEMKIKKKSKAIPFCILRSWLFNGKIK